MLWGNLMNLCLKKALFFLLLIPFSLLLPASRIAKKSSIIVRTVPEASAHMRKIAENFPKDAALVSVYEKEQADVMVKSAKVLYDNARDQILYALSDIDNRIAYWQYQKDHPWNYFVSKNPLKWVTGPRQKDEVEDNLEALYSHQGHLYTILGQLAERSAIFTQGYKDIFLIDYKKGYEWIDELLNTLSGLAAEKKATSGVPFVARTQQLQAKLDNVLDYKDSLLFDISSTQVPSYIERNWLKSGMFLVALGYGYNNLTLEQIQAPFMTIGSGIQENVITPVQQVMSDVFRGKQPKEAEDLLVSQENITAVHTAVEKFLNNVSSASLVGEAYISPERKQEILNEVLSGGSSKLQALGSELSQYWGGTKAWAEAKVLFAELAALQAGVRIQTKLERLEKQFVGVGKIAFITPALLLGLASYTGYKKWTKKSYAALRRALVEINSLFVDPSKALTDEQYGKMLYLVYNLKNRAKKELPLKRNQQAEFIHDLERIESQDLPVAAKRAVIKDMFRKYEFLGLINKK